MLLHQAPSIHNLSVRPLLFLLLYLPLSSHVWGIEYVPGGILKRPGTKSPLSPFHRSHHEEAPRLPLMSLNSV